MMWHPGPEDRMPDWRKRPVEFAVWLLIAGPLLLLVSALRLVFKPLAFLLGLFKEKP